MTQLTKEKDLHLKIPAFLAIGLVLAGALAAPRGAESAELDPVRRGVKEIVDDVTLRCRFDLETYCANVTPGEGRLAFCLMAHADKRSPQCEYALFDASRAANRLIENVDASIEACQTDIATFCTGMVPGQGSIAKCLADQKPSLSQRCGEVLDVVGNVIFPIHNQPAVEGATHPSAPADAVTEASPSEAAPPAPMAPVLTALAAKVQDIIEKGKQGCRSDLESYCSNVAPGEGRLAFCLIANADKRSTACESALTEARSEAEGLIESVDQSIDACQPDIAALCSGTEIGQGRIAQCLADQRPSLSERCGQVVDMVGQVVFPAHNQPVVESPPPPAPSAGITTGTINHVPATTGTDAGKDKCRTVEASVTDWDKEATSRDARKLLGTNVTKYAARHGINDYKSEGATVTCSTNVNLVIAGNYTCRARTQVCWSLAEGGTTSPGNASKPQQ
jgi:hypothetical protein